MDNCSIITMLDNKPIGFVVWDPRNLPDYVEIGHNCIIAKHKGKGYGKAQLKEAIKRITLLNPKKIIVTTNEGLISAQRYYESVGFEVSQRRTNDSETAFSGDYIDYSISL